MGFPTPFPLLLNKTTLFHLEIMESSRDKALNGDHALHLLLKHIVLTKIKHLTAQTFLH